MNKYPEKKYTPKFNLQLLADKSVILLEANGYESEIFLPKLLRGRITMVNIYILNREHSKLGNSPDAAKALPLKHCKKLLNRKVSSITASLVSKRHHYGPSGRAGSNDASANSDKSQFELKLVSRGNVVLAECKGYESEIFIPHICSHCLSLKRVSGHELMHCTYQRPVRRQAEPGAKQNKAAVLAASLAAQAMGLSKLLIKPICEEQKDKLAQTKLRKKPTKQNSKAAGDAFFLTNTRPLTKSI